MRNQLILALIITNLIWALVVLGLITEFRTGTVYQRQDLDKGTQIQIIK